MKRYQYHLFLDRFSVNDQGRFIANPLIFSGARCRCDVSPVQAANLYRKLDVPSVLDETFITLESVKKSIIRFGVIFPTLAGGA